MVSFEMNDRKKIGLGLTGFGVLFSFLGIIFFFDKGLLAMGNILFLSGVMVTIGLKSTMQFFTKPRNYKWFLAHSGSIRTTYTYDLFSLSLASLDSGFWPTVAVFVQRIPILGWIFQQPFVASFLDRFRTKRVPV
ncbi:vesicle transport protein GOT1 isoform X2 [Amborella trichopoda]|uniref:vesicle transport protein GOT1 isoform X2 n=1 Tax=Amborella trichopoda TaxID=13333 RepID=UPI0009C17F9E|nr:vesicle transport protein GOT1 isoform X2 [Amborella trichopoda]|eukprot:XP_020519699.1 vesicle transport protein GOT1 isoform X2 [Amborella trichopoda]